MDLLDLYANNITNSEFFINIFSHLESILIFLIIGASIPVELFIMIKSDCIDESKTRKFKKYINCRSSGYGLRNIDISKEYIILTSDFFNNISEHGGSRYRANLDDARERILIEYGYKYNIIIYAGCAYSKKFNKIIEYCHYKNYPVCRVIDFLPRGEFVEERITLSNGDKIYYYKLNEGE